MLVNLEDQSEDEPRISIIMPCFNAAATVAETMTSVASQNVPAEIVVQDGGSTDGTLEILRQFGSRISVESEKDSGQSNALNKALARATGDVVGWLNADDLYMPGALEHVLTFARKHPEVDVIYGDFVLIRSDGKQLRRYYVQDWNWDRFISHGCYVWSGATFYRRRVFEQYGGFNEQLQYCMDGDFIFRIAQSVNAAHIPYVLGAFRIHNNSKSGGTPFRFVREGFSVRWMHSGGSFRLRGYAVWAAFRSSLYLLTRRIWLSDTWSSIRSEKKL
jgi:glycosyltransferase involved in cell wall biosynthesis